MKSDENESQNTYNEMSTGDLGLIMQELQVISNRIFIIEQKIESVNKIIEHKFASFTHLDEQLYRLETMYKNIDGLDNRIILQEESLTSMVEKHLQIIKSIQELSQTSKDVYELLKLSLLGSIVENTRLD